MCGFIGRYARHANPFDISDLRRATGVLAYRGPDGSGYWAEPPFYLGHRRLAVIDLAHGQQPMASADFRHVIAFNGEIYNYIELRDELVRRGHRFVGASDTEVIINGYREWGTDLPGHLDGMFAFAIADRVEKSLFLARDRFGEKPLFIHEDARGIVTFASTLGALTSLPDVELAVDAEALGDYLCLNYVPGLKTMAQGIHRLAPGSWRLYETSGVCEETYWTARAAVLPADIKDLKTAADAVAVLLDRSVAGALRSDVPVALFLSGGIDSSLIAESAVRQGGLDTAFCLDFREASYSEFAGASRVASQLDLKLERVEMTQSELGTFCEMVGHADDPLADSSALAVGCLARAVGASYKVALSGDGGDELFGGYLTYAASALHRKMSTVLPLALRHALQSAASLLPVSSGKVSLSYKAWRFLRAAALPTAEAHFSWNGTWLPQDAARLVTDHGARRSAMGSLQRMARRHGLDDRPGLSDLQRADIGDYLANDILVKVDRMTMAYGLESRAPFLSADLAELGLALPDRFKRAPGIGSKAVLRTLAERRFGSVTARAPKQGFGIPLHQWLRGPARPLMEDLLGMESLRAIPLLDANVIAGAKARHLSGRAQLGYEMWGLMVLVAWHRIRMVRGSLAPVSAVDLPALEFPRAA